MVENQCRVEVDADTELTWQLAAIKLADARVDDKPTSTENELENYLGRSPITSRHSVVSRTPYTQFDGKERVGGSAQFLAETLASAKTALNERIHGPPERHPELELLMGPNTQETKSHK